MDFAKKLEKHENVVTKSGITLLPVTENDNEVTEAENNDGSLESMEHHVKKLLIESANKAAADLFLASGAKIFQTLINERLKKKRRHGIRVLEY